MVVELIYQHLNALGMKLHHQQLSRHANLCSLHWSTASIDACVYLFCSAIYTVNVLHKMNILLLEGANILVKHVLQDTSYVGR